MRLTSNQGEHDNPEGRLQLCMLIEVVENHLCHFATLQFEDYPDAVPVRLIPYV